MPSRRCFRSRVGEPADAGAGGVRADVLAAQLPAERLPDWLATIDRFLPVQAMGEVIRGTVASNVFPLTLEPFVVLTVWCVAGFGIAYRALSRRG